MCTWALSLKIREKSLTGCLKKYPPCHSMKITSTYKMHIENITFHMASIVYVDYYKTISNALANASLRH